jgi:monoamine oxidase
MPRTSLFLEVRRLLRNAEYVERTREPAGVARERAEEELWNRRRFLRTSAVAAAGAVAAPFFFSRAALARNASRVLILGGGTAGLTCAYRLQQAGVSAQIVEASYRVGGRMFSLRNFFPDNQIAELGGELIDGQHTAIRALAKELDVPLLDLAYINGTGDHTYSFGGKLYRADAELLDGFLPIARAVRRDVGARGEHCDVTADGGSEEGKRLDRMSVAGWLDAQHVGRDEVIRKAIEMAIVGEFGLELDQQSALNFLCSVGNGSERFELFGESNERYHIPEGNDMIPTRLAQEIVRPADVGVIVERMRTLPDGRIEVSVRRGSTSHDLVADVVVTTIPLTTMRKRVDTKGLTLSPRVRGAIENLGYGTNSKLMIGLDSRPWVDLQSTAYTFTDAGFQACWDTSRGQSGTHGILTNFTGGKIGASMGEETLGIRARRFADQVDKVFPGVGAAFNGKAARQVWPKHEWTNGSYVCFMPGQRQLYAGVFEEPEGNLIFAGEHTVAESGFMNSAVESGERAARQVLAALRATASEDAA